MSDLNQDGLVDVVAACADSGVSVLIGAGNGAFRDHTDYLVGGTPGLESARRVAIGDLNADGISDLAVTDAEASTVTTLLGVGDGSFGARQDYLVGLGPYAIVVGDFNEDGWGDVVTGNAEGKSLSFLFSTAGSSLLAHREYILPSAKPLSLAAADFNADGHLDLAIGTRTFWSGNFLVIGTFSVLLGNGNATFQPRIVLSNEVDWPSIVTADVDSDGILDLVCGNEHYNWGAVEIRRGLGDGHFLDPVVIGVEGAHDVVVGDMNKDGHIDVVATDGDKVEVLLGHGDATFDSVGEVPLGYYWGQASSSLALGDINQDGQLDVLSSNAGSVATGSVAVLLNRWVNPPPYAAMAFLLGQNRPVPLRGPGTPICFQIQPVDGDYRNEDVELATTMLQSIDTGTVYSIYSVSGGPVEIYDENNDGIAEVRACFSGKDLDRLFSRVRGRQRVEVWLSACLRSGGDIRGRVELEFVGPPRLPYAEVSPNPLNANGDLTVTTAESGHLSTAIYDAQGRLVWRDLDRPVTPGRISVKLGNDREGRSLPSGIYFYKVDAPDGTLTGRFAVLR